MSKQITVVDSSVLINAAIGPNAARRMRALTVVGDPNREFAASRYLHLEVLPIPTMYQKHKERRFYELFFSNVTIWLDEASLIQPALDLACQFGLGAMDALHLAAAVSVNAEFISAEKPTKPIYQAWQNISSIY
ncbi:MAG: type II toxin-antitoxin system VapC family toxin [Blastocatellia bacterium]